MRKFSRPLRDSDVSSLRLCSMLSITTIPSKGKLLLMAVLALVPSCLYWVAVVRPPAKRRKELAAAGKARAALAQQELREATLQLMKNYSHSVEGITLSSVVRFDELRSMLSEGKVQAVEIHNLFRLRAAVSHGMTHCLVGFIPEAAKIAQVRVSGTSLFSGCRCNLRARFPSLHSPNLCCRNCEAGIGWLVLRWRQECDAAFQAKKSLGVLHGIPVSIKESIEVKVRSRKCTD